LASANDWSSVPAQQPSAADEIAADSKGARTSPYTVTRLHRRPRSTDTSSDEEHVTTTWRQETVGCTLQLERFESWFPGDVNQPAVAQTRFSSQGTWRDATTSATCKPALAIGRCHS